MYRSVIIPISDYKIIRGLYITQHTQYESYKNIVLKGRL